MHWLPHTNVQITACYIIVIIIPWYTLITVTHACRVSLFFSYGSWFMLHVLLFHFTVCMLYDCFLLLIWISHYWTWELLICDMWNPTSIVPASRYIVPVILFPFPVILFYAINRTLVSYHVTRIMYCICSCYNVYLTYQIIKLTGVWGRLDGWLDHIGWMSGSIVHPTAGDGIVLATICYSWAPVSRYVLAHWDSRYKLQP